MTGGTCTHVPPGYTIVPVICQLRFTRKMDLKRRMAGRDRTQGNDQIGLSEDLTGLLITGHNSVRHGSDPSMGRVGLGLLAGGSNGSGRVQGK